MVLLAQDDDSGPGNDANLTISRSAGTYTLRLGASHGTLGDGSWATDLINNSRSLTITTLTEANSTAGSLVLGGSGAAVATLQVNSGTVTLTDTGTCLNPRAGGKVSVGGGTLIAKGSIVIDGGTLERTSGTFTWDPNRTMTIRNGGKASFTGSYALPNGAYILIRDANSQLSTTGILQVNRGSRIDANGAGLISAGGLDLGINANGIIVVDGLGSRLTSGDAYIGSGGGTGSLTLQNGAYGVIGTGTAYVGQGTAAGSCGIVLVQSEANLVFTGPLWVGASAGGAQTSTVTVTGGNSSITQSGAGSLVVGAADGSTGVIHVDANGTFTGATGLTTINKTGTISVNGGTYNAKGNILIDGGALDYSAGTLNWDANRTMTIRNGGRFTFSGWYETPIGSYILVQDANSRIQGTWLYVINGARLDANSGEIGRAHV
jgi:T5SS/PEP-CTERM-associated repeat protein